MDRKDWQKPELIVLVRSNPEEAVLTFCKMATTGAGAACANKNACGDQTVTTS
jgi:hypothetical protein